MHKEVAHFWAPTRTCFLVASFRTPCRSTVAGVAVIGNLISTTPVYNNIKAGDAQIRYRVAPHVSHDKLGHELAPHKPIHVVGIYAARLMCGIIKRSKILFA